MSDDTIIEEEKEKNIIKEVCYRYDFTYKKLADELGYSEGSIRNLSSKGNDEIPLNVKKSIELLYKTKEYEKEIKEFSLLRNLLRIFIEKDK